MSVTVVYVMLMLCALRSIVVCPKIAGEGHDHDHERDRASGVLGFGRTVG